MSVFGPYCVICWSHIKMDNAWPFAYGSVSLFLRSNSPSHSKRQKKVVFKDLEENTQVSKGKLSNPQRIPKNIWLWCSYTSACHQTCTYFQLLRDMLNWLTSKTVKGPVVTRRIFNIVYFLYKKKSTYSIALSIS